MRTQHRLATALVSMVLGWAWIAAAAEPAPAAPFAARVRWLAELGAESLTTGRPPAPDAEAAVVAAVPGAAYVFGRNGDGGLVKRRRLAADSAAPHGVAVAGRSVALADRSGRVSLWDLSGAEPSLRWSRELGERVTSVGWDGGRLVFVATWSGRLSALGADDGSSKWSVELGGRAEAPAVVDSGAVFVATKTKVLCRIAAATGSIRWKAPLPGLALQAPVFLGEPRRLVVVGTWDGQLLAYEAATGREAWSAALGAKLAGAPLATPSGLVVVVTTDGAVRGYDPAGNSSWTAPGAADGPATLLWQESAGAAARLLSVSKVLVSLNASTGERLADYPQGALDELRQRFADAMLEGTKTYSEAEKRALQEREAFDISEPPFGSVRLFGPDVVFGTEDGWVFVFDANSLRPVARYRAGQPCSNAPRLVAARVIASAGEDIHALDARTGDLVWHRPLGAEPGAILGDETLAVQTGARVHAIAASDGSLRWSLRGEFRHVTPASNAGIGSERPWLVEAGTGQLRALVPPGHLVADAVPIEGAVVASVATSSVAAAGASHWIVATEGQLLGVSWEGTAGEATDRWEGRLGTSWQKLWIEPILGLEFAGGRALVRSGAGLVAFDPVTQEETWRLALAKDDRVVARPDAGSVLVLCADALRVHDWLSGEPRRQLKLSSPALAADQRGPVVRWLDRAGRLWQSNLDDAQPATTDLGVALAEASAVEGGFLVRTAAGEVGFVEVE